MLRAESHPAKPRLAQRQTVRISLLACYPFGLLIQSTVGGALPWTAEQVTRRVKRDVRIQVEREPQGRRPGWCRVG